MASTSKKSASGDKGTSGADGSTGAEFDALKIIADENGFRRAGRAWSKEPPVVARSTRTDEQTKPLENEPRLQITAVALADEAESN